MIPRRTLGQLFLGRDVAVAYAVIVALYLVRYVRFQPVQIPGYLLIVAYDLVEVTVPLLSPYHSLGFPLFLYLLAIVGAGTARWLRPGDRETPAWIRTSGGVCLVVGSLSLLFGAFVGGPIVSPTDHPTPLAIAGATGIVFLVGGWWLLGRPPTRDGAA